MLLLLLQWIAARLPAPVIHRIVAWRWRSAAASRLLDPLARTMRQGTVVIPAGIARGMRIDANGENASYALGTIEPLVQQIFATHIRPGAVVYDIGANIGFFTLAAARLTGPHGRVYAFEPAMSTADRLAANVALNDLVHVEVLRVGVGRNAGRALLVKTDISQTASLYAAGAESVDAADEVAVAVVALDDLVRDGCLAPPAFVKMDIEGAEVEALEGMRGLLAKHRPVMLCEVHGTHAAVAAIFEAHGYHVRVVETGGALTDAPDYVHALALPGEVEAG